MFGNLIYFEIESYSWLFCKSFHYFLSFCHYPHYSTNITPAQVFSVTSNFLGFITHKLSTSLKHPFKSTNSYRTRWIILCGDYLSRHEYSAVSTAKAPRLARTFVFFISLFFNIIFYQGKDFSNFGDEAIKVPGKK